METIKNYLDSMFANLPNTPEVKKAKDELFQMMEDKYNELLADGMSDNAAVGTVISEFGNLDEIAQELGIDNALENSANVEKRQISLEEAGEYLADSKSWALKIAIGVALCILSVAACIFSDSIKGIGGDVLENFGDTVGVTAMFVLIAVAVMIIIYASTLMKKWKFIENQACAVDLATSEFMKKEETAFTPKYALLLSIGVALCIISVLPAAFADELDDILKSSIDFDSIGGGFMFVFIAIGVFFIVYAANVKGSFDKLFKATARKSCEDGGKYVSDEVNEEGGNVYTASEDAESGKKFISPAAETFMDVFWPTVTCIYLSWSFITFDWYITWVIWPIAAVLNAVLESALMKRS